MPAEVVEVITRRDIRTSVGTIAAGSTRRATLAGEGWWLLEIGSAPKRMIGQPPRYRTVLVPANVIRYATVMAAAVSRRQALQHDYWFAITHFGWSRDTTLVWLARGYSVSVESLKRWRIGVVADE